MNLMERLKAYKFRIYPTEEQEIFSVKSFGCVRKVYNLMLNDWINAYGERKQNFSKKCPFQHPQNTKKIKEVDSLVLANIQL